MLSRDSYIKAVKRPYPALYTSLFMTGFRQPELFSPFLKEKFSIDDMLYLEGDWYYLERSVKEGGELALRSWRDPAFFALAQAEYDRRADALSAPDTWDLGSYFRAYEAFMPAISLIWFVEKPTEDALRAALSARASSEEVEGLMSALNTPLRPNFYRQEQRDLAVATDLEEHARKYRWLPSRYGEEKEYTVEDARQKREAMDAEAFLKEWDEQQERVRAAIKKAKELADADADLVDIFQYMIFYRTHRTDILNRSSYLAMPLIKERARELGLSYRELLACTGEEALSGSLPPASLVAERMEGVSLLLEGGKVTCLSGAASKEAMRRMEEGTEGVTELKGTVACRGKVQGKVRVVDSKTFMTVEDGEILVTSMTTPQMVPYMKKAIAFVTDEGGVTCHAAVLSREMKTPCVIGTKVATKALRTGDMVEVDAEKGIVRKI